MTREEIRIAGLGGQGIVLAGIILGSAALHDEKNATQVQSYGAEARGGSCKSEVVISAQSIYYPQVREADIFVVMSQEAYDRYIGGLKEGGLQIVDGDLVRKIQKRGRTLEIPATKLATERLKNKIVGNMIMLGALVSATNVVSRQALEKAVRERVPKGTEEINLKALEIGYETAESWKAE